ncbi:MAG: hypothetical protein PSX36_13860 [bacterium]|nr:hypothetical protein [bacterium]
MNFNRFILIWLLLGLSKSYAQDSIQSQLDAVKSEITDLKKIEKSHFMIRGFTQFGLDASSEDLSFNMTSFNPIILWRHGDRFLFESELEMEYMSNIFSLNLGYASASYLVTKGLVIKGGKILIPFGTFGEKFHPSWSNKLASAPLGFGHDGMVPMADVGVEVKGGVQVGSAKLSYAAYAVNGPRIKDGTEEPTEAGMLSFENMNDNNRNKAFGARLGILPLQNSSLELGGSVYYALPGSFKSPFAGDPKLKDLNYNNVTALLTALDLCFVKIIQPLSGVLDIKGQYNVSKISNATYFNPSDTARYTFQNNASSYYIQVAFRPSLLDNKVLKNFELVGRYSVYNTPKKSLWESEQSQIQFGLDYWFTWRTVIKVSYQINNGTMGGSGMSSMAGMAGMSANVILFHIATGF